VRRRKVTYPPPKTATSGNSSASTGADARAAAAASRVASINLQAMTGRAGIVQGTRVQITSGIYAGEFAIVESVVGGVIPAAIVRTEAGRTRRARTVDLVPSPASRPDAAPAPAPVAATSEAPPAPEAE
jgi:hypothetical protein